MARLTRKELKSDKFALEVQHSVEYVSEHRQQLIRWGGIGVAVLVLVLAVFLYRNHMHGVRQEALHHALGIQDANVGNPANASPYAVIFPTDAERQKAAVQAFTELAAKYPGTQEGVIGEFFLGTNAADQRRLRRSREALQTGGGLGKPNYASVAKLSLAQVYAAQGKLADGEKLIQSVIDHPTVLVSKDAASWPWASCCSKSNPERARKLIEPLRGSSRANISTRRHQRDQRTSAAEVTALSRLRFPVAGSRGRRYPELAHPYRNEFQRDRDRIIHSRAFRRLENKTQVFPAGISDHFRNRLTHTIEVSQIARTVAAALGLNEDLTEALSLGHDIGHPPFAHAGEEELDRQMQRFGDRFDHNLHALRIVESFEHRYARFPGLNLTFEVREGIVKHSHDFDPGDNPALDEYLPGLRPPLEAQLIDLADEIAYNTADLDDAFSAGLFGVEAACQEVPEFAHRYEQAEGQFPGASCRERFQEVVRGLGRRAGLRPDPRHVGCC